MKTRKPSSLPHAVKKNKKKRFPRILIWDLETAGINAFNADQGYVVCFGYRWLGESKARCLTLADFPLFHKDFPENVQKDSQLLAAALEIMEEADLLVAHYGDKFDKPFLQSRLIHNGLPPLPKTRQVDTCLQARHILKLSSNRMDNVARFLNCETRKMPKGNGWPDWWFGVMRGDVKAMNDMAKYCCQDVDCLAEIFEKMRHLIPPKYMIHAGIGVDREVCSNCGGDVQYRGTYFSAKKKFRRFQCKKCGKWDHETKSTDKAL